MFKFISRQLEAHKLKPFKVILAESLKLSESVSTLSDAELQDQSNVFKAALASGASLSTLLPKVMAVAREAAFRSLGLRPYDVQVLGALVLAHGGIAQMGTGEGKTLVAPMAAYVGFLKGEPVHISTTNEYLAVRDANTMQPFYKMLGMTVAVTLSTQSIETKRGVYGFDVVYGTPVEFALDYLRDNLAMDPEDVGQGVKGRGMAIVDEADSVLIDEARSPVTLSTSEGADVELYSKMSELASAMQSGEEGDACCDFWVDGKNRTAVLTDQGYDKGTTALKGLGVLSDEDPLYGPKHQALLHKLTAALSARYVLHRDHHYVVRDGALVLVDELTGRLMPGRTWSAGLQQALEAKEGVTLTPEATILAICTLQNFYRQYRLLAGMTGTAETEAEELKAVYGLDVFSIPANKPCIRIDEPDRIFRSEPAKFEAVVAEIKRCHAHDRPVLVGTASIEQSETLAKRLTEEGLPHEVLNARQFEREGEIIAQAGRPGAITVSTNMAGRGVDIVLGGNVNLDLFQMVERMGEAAWNVLTPEQQHKWEAEIRRQHAERADRVREAGGLHVIGMERYDARRMDRQLMGRAGRQGDPGSSAFFISLEDPLVEHFGGERVRGMLTSLDIKSGDELETRLLAKVVDSSQRQIEGRSAAVRKQVMQYDDVLNMQREGYYAQRNAILEETQFDAFIETLLCEQLAQLARTVAPEHVMYENWDFDMLTTELKALGMSLPEEAALAKMEDGRDLEEVLLEMAKLRLAEQFTQVETAVRPRLQRRLILDAMDRHWFAQLAEMEHLRKGIHLRAHAKQDPQHAYKQESYNLFEGMLNDIKVEVLRVLMTWRR